MTISLAVDLPAELSIAGRRRRDSSQKFVDRFLSSDASVLMITGPYGAGKTSLLRAITSTARQAIWQERDEGWIAADLVTQLSAARVQGCAIVCIDSFYISPNLVMSERAHEAYRVLQVAAQSDVKVIIGARPSAQFDLQSLITHLQSGELRGKLHWLSLMPLTEEQVALWLDNAVDRDPGDNTAALPYSHLGWLSLPRFARGLANLPVKPSYGLMEVLRASLDGVAVDEELRTKYGESPASGDGGPSRELRLASELLNQIDTALPLSLKSAGVTLRDLEGIIPYLLKEAANEARQELLARSWNPSYPFLDAVICLFLIEDHPLFNSLLRGMPAEYELFLRGIEMTFDNYVMVKLARFQRIMRSDGHSLALSYVKDIQARESDSDIDMTAHLGEEASSASDYLMHRLKAPSFYPALPLTIFRLGMYGDPTVIPELRQLSKVFSSGSEVQMLTLRAISCIKRRARAYAGHGSTQPQLASKPGGQREWIT